jgi:hypothetical protein
MQAKDVRKSDSNAPVSDSIEPGAARATAPLQEPVSGKAAAASQVSSKTMALKGGSPSQAVHASATVALGSEPASSEAATAPPVESKPRARWVIVAAGSAALLTLLTVAAVILVTRPTSTIDQLVILTVPSGAEVTFDSQQLGHSPVKLEGVRIGHHKLAISKDGFESIEEDVAVQEAGSLDFKLKPLPPKGAMGLPPEEAMKVYEQRAEDAFARGDYAVPYPDSALYYAELMAGLDTSSQSAINMRSRVQKALHQSAQSAEGRGDLSLAQQLYGALAENYPDDKEAQAGQIRVQEKLGAKHGDVRDLVRRAGDALKAGSLIDPPRSSAYYYSKQALAIDRQNPQAKSIYNQVRETLRSESERAIQRQDLDSAGQQLAQLIHLFPEDRQLRARFEQVEEDRRVTAERVSSPTARRIRGLEAYARDDFAAAIPDLEYSIQHDRRTPEVVFALGRSYLRTGQTERAASYFREVPASAEDTFRSSIAALGDIALAHNDYKRALERYREARTLGGSALYSPSSLDDKIENLEKRQRAPVTEPSAVSIQVKHLHGGLLHGSCSGVLAVTSTGVRYDGSDAGRDSFSTNLIGVNVRVVKDELTIQFQSKVEKFKALRPDLAERFREALASFQSYATAPK